VYPFTIVRPDRAVVVKAASVQQLAERLPRWTGLGPEEARRIAPSLWRGRVVFLEETALLRGEVST
jgi:hypothetical protein